MHWCRLSFKKNNFLKVLFKKPCFGNCLHRKFITKHNMKFFVRSIYAYLKKSRCSFNHKDTERTVPESKNLTTALRGEACRGDGIFNQTEEQTPGIGASPNGAAHGRRRTFFQHSCLSTYTRYPNCPSSFPEERRRELLETRIRPHNQAPRHLNQLRCLIEKRQVDIKSNGTKTRSRFDKTTLYKNYTTQGWLGNTGKR